MSTLNEQEAVLRRALLAAAEQVDPAPDGFERIQRRLRRPRPLPIAWIEAMWTDLFLNAPDFVHKLGWQVSRAFRAVVDRFGPVTGEHAHGPKWTGWLRPVAAMSVAVFVIAAGAYAAMGGDTGLFSPTSNHTSPTGTNPASGNGHPSGVGTPAAGSSSRAPSSGPSSSPSSVTKCKTSPPAFSQPPASSPATSPSTSPATSPSTTPTPTPTPSDTTSSTGSDGGTPGTSTSPSTTKGLDARTTSVQYNAGSEKSSSDSTCPSTGTTGKKNTSKTASPDAASSAPHATAQLAADESPARRNARETL